MPIKNFITGQVPYLEKYTQYSLPTTATSEVINISDMVTYTLEPTTSPVVVEYKLGAQRSYITTLLFKNITTNAQLELTILYYKNFFHLDFIDKPLIRETSNMQREVIKLLKPTEVLKVDILVNNSILDLGQIREGRTNIRFTVKNLFTGEIITTTPQLEKYVLEGTPGRVRIE